MLERAGLFRISVPIYMITQHYIPGGYFHSQHYDKSDSQVVWGVLRHPLLPCYVSNHIHSAKENSAKLCTGSSSEVLFITAYSMLILTPDGIHNDLGLKNSKLYHATVILTHISLYSYWAIVLHFHIIYC
jgi:hypothetical protein